MMLFVYSIGYCVKFQYSIIFMYHRDISYENNARCLKIRHSDKIDQCVFYYLGCIFDILFINHNNNHNIIIHIIIFFNILIHIHPIFLCHIIRIETFLIVDQN